MAAEIELDLAALAGLRAAPSQVWGAVRLVPLVREAVREDLRVGRRSYEAPLAGVRLEGRPGGRGVFYGAYVPHGLVFGWTDDGAPVTDLETRLEDGEGASWGPFKALHRMARVEEPRRLRLLPLHLAMEGFLAAQFGGPTVAWEDYSRRALSSGLSPRVEPSLPGACVPGLAEALQVFEIHEGQCGVLVFVADALASAFVLSHPEDYRALHRSLVEDFFGQLLLHYGRLAAGVQEHRVALPDAGVNTPSDLRRALDRARAEWADFDLGMACGLLRRVRAEPLRRLGPFQLVRFIGDLSPGDESHLGEAILRGDGELMYLKTYRLSEAQRRRGWLLQQLSERDWDFALAARSMGLEEVGLAERLIHAGLGDLLSPQLHREVARRRGGGGGRYQSS
jgi:hypothetical protein